MSAARIVVSIRHVVWRQGRPRFVPGPRLRAMGFKGHDLKHADGRWFDLGETEGFVAGLLLDIEARKASGAARRKDPVRRAGWYGVAELFAELFREPRFQPQDQVRVKALAPHTVRFYKAMSKALQDHHLDLWVAAVTSVTAVDAWNLYEKTYRNHGLHMARGVVATCRMAWSWAKRKGRVTSNPFKELGMETPRGRVNAASPAAIRHFVAVCDREKRPEIGDMVLLGCFSGQRQADRLALTFQAIASGRFRVEQGKTGRRVSAAIPAPLLARLEAARERRKDHKVQWPQAVIDERAGQPFRPDYYRHVFAALRDKAAADCPALAGFRDQDLRDTALSWARAGGADFDTRRQLSGHSASAAALEEKHYLAQAESSGDGAVAAIMTVWETSDDRPRK